jgi:glucosylceramidase
MTLVWQLLQVKIMASPWSAPAWMKESGTLNGGQLKTGDQYLTALAEFFVRFVKSYEALGIHIDTVTLQNEPEHSTSGYPTMSMPWDVQRDAVIKLGRRFAEEGITTEIVILDHNWDLTWSVKHDEIFTSTH